MRKAQSFTSGCSGFSLLDAMTGVALLTLGFMGLASSMVASSRSCDDAKEDALVNHSLRRMAETLRASPFTETLVKYQNYAFAIPSLVDGAGTVTFFVNEKDNSSDAQRLGLPRDLDGDGLATKLDVTSSFNLLPCKIRATWTSRDGLETRDLFILLAQGTD